VSSGPLAVALVAFVVLMFGIGFRARARIRTLEDYLVAGRKLSWPLASATLFATWFGAGTMLAATDEARSEGLRAAALEPIGPGVCLVLAGLFFAARLWRMKLLTLPDFYRRRFGVRAEIVSSVIMVPGYFGWIAAQFVALAGILEVFWQVPVHHGIWLVAAVGTAYTLLGGMWSVTMTDAAQFVLMIAGLVVLAATVLVELGADAGLAAGWARLVAATPPEHLVLVPTESAAELVGWLSVLAIGALGNIPGQDLAQRIFAARSERAATTACCVAGVFYVLFGMVPVTTGLAANVLGIDGAFGTLPALAATVMTPVVAIVFVLGIVSTVMSTIESAILAPSSVLSNNLLVKLLPHANPLALGRLAILAVAGASLAMSYAGASAYELLETAYAIGMVALFVPLARGLTERGDEAAALGAMTVGTALWGAHLAFGWDAFGGPALGLDAVPQELAATFCAWIAYEGIARRRRFARVVRAPAPLPTVRQ